MSIKRDTIVHKGVNNMKREEISSEYKWDLSHLFKTDDEFDANIQAAKAELKQLKEMKGSLTTSIENFIHFFELNEQFQLKRTDAEVYAQMSCDVDPDNEMNQEHLAQAQSLDTQAMNELTFVDLELIKNRSIVEEYLKDERCHDYQYPVECIFRTIPHRLDEKTEELLSQVNELCSIPENTYQSLRLEFKDVMVDGEPQFLNGATFREFLTNTDPKVRKEAYENYFSEYKKLSSPYSNLLIGHTKTQIFKAKIRNFDSALQASLFEDEVDTKLFDLVCNMANEKYIHAFHDYNTLKKKLLHLDTLHYYDLNVPLVKSVDIKYSVEDCFKIYQEALKPLGDEYISLLKTAQDERWVDYMTHEGKRPGAYSWGTYTSKPYVCMNFISNYDSLSTLSHELGHSMHSYYSNKFQRPMLSGYRIFVAEVASTVNEILVNQYLLKTSTDKDYKAYILYNLLDQLVGTIYRQPMFAQFEAQLHELIEKGDAVSNKTCMDLFYKLSKDHYGKDVELDENLHGAGCYYIPHFYYNFYVYKYTIGMSVALSFVKKIMNGQSEDYLSFLKKGGSESPVDELIHSGVNPYEEEVYDDAFTFFIETCKQFEELMKE